MTSMLARVFAVGLLGFAASIGTAKAEAAIDESSWTDLEDDTSRATLFDDAVKPAKVEQEAGAPDKPIDLAIPKVFYFPDDARTDVILNKPRENAIFGIDVSHYTTKDLNHAMLRFQEVRFVYVKATQGTGYKDSLFKYFWTSLHQLDGSRAISVGAYHFLSAGIGGTDQAKRFVDFVNLNGGFSPGDMPPCLDLEWDRTASNPDRWSGTDPDAIVDNAIQWLEYVSAKTGRTPLLYTARSWLDGIGIKGDRLARLTKYPLWIADYSSTHKAVEKPSVPKGGKNVLWQFASDAKLTAGYKRGLDANIYYGSEEDFVRDFGIQK